MSDMIYTDIDTLWHEYHSPLTNYVKRRVSQSETVEDIVQTVFIKAWDAMCRGMGATESISGWLFRIAHNLIVDCYRDRTLRPDAVSLDDPLSDTANRLPSLDLLPHEIVEQDETCATVRRAVARLIDSQRSVIERTLDGYSYDEIAAELGKGYEATKILHVRGRQNMRIFLDPDYKQGPKVKMARCVTRPAVPESRLSPLARQVQELISKHGTLPVAQIAWRLNKAKSVINKVLRVNPETFAVVGFVPARAIDATCWGLVGIHDREAA